MMYKVSIEGVTPYIQRWFNVDIPYETWERENSSLFEKHVITDYKEKRAAYFSYFDEQQNFVIPSSHVVDLLSKQFKGYNNKDRYSISCNAGEGICLPKFDSFFEPVGTFLKESKRGCLPMWRNWSIEFMLSIYPRIPVGVLIDAFIVCGEYNGIGFLRPEMTGQYGKFKLLSLNIE